MVTTNGPHGFVSHVPYNHYSLLTTIEANWNLGFLGHAGEMVKASGAGLQIDASRLPVLVRTSVNAVTLPTARPFAGNVALRGPPALAG